MMLFQDFKKPSLEEWKSQLLKDLKTDQFENEWVDHQIEGIKCPAYLTAEHASSSKESFDNLTADRGYLSEDNAWHNGLKIEVKDAKRANDQAIQYLQKGVDALYFEISDETISLSELFKGIEFQYIETIFKVNSWTFAQQILEILPTTAHAHIRFSFPLDAIHLPDFSLDFLTDHPLPYFSINGFLVQQTGANNLEELSYVIAQAQEVLHQLTHLGLPIDTASACLHVELGIGNQYIYEIAKIRAFRTLWTNLLMAYQPEHTCSTQARISAHIGWVNKSLKDPYTNLLRQSTEAMSAIIGGVDLLFVHPYDALAENGASEFATQLAVNIPLILKEESYFDKVIDPIGGSYTLEFLTEELARKSWTKFLEIENLGGIESSAAQNGLRDSIQQTVSKRIQALKDKKSILIGINQFLNPEQNNQKHERNFSCLGLNNLILENEI